jgi:hypothetical protein
MPYSEDDLPLHNYDRQSAGAIAAKLSGLSQAELRIVRSYESEHERRAVVLDRIAELAVEEPWPGYDDLGADEIASALVEADPPTLRRVLAYERDHRARAGVVDGARRLAAVYKRTP